MQASSEDRLRHFFTGVTEHAFVARLGIADPPLVDYVADMLIRFVRCDAVYRIRDLAGQRLDEVAAQMAEADQRVGEARRDVHRHVGDFTLFWTGLYPEALRTLQSDSRRDFFLDYCQQGKRAYLIASTIPGDEDSTNGELLQRLSHEYDMCAYGLGEVRREWARQEDDSDTPPIWN